MSLAALGLALGTCAMVAVAQWPVYEVPAAPRNDDGSIDLEAPAPVGLDGHPDLSGVWEPKRQAFGGANAKGKGGPPPPFAKGKGKGGFKGRGKSKANLPKRGVGEPGLANFADLNNVYQEGIPYTDWALKVKEGRMANNSKDNPDAHCMPLGLMQLHTHPYEKKIVQSPSTMVIMYDANNDVRQILTDGREPVELTEDLAPWFYGYSVGHWEDDTLVVETVGFRDDVWLDVNGSPLTHTGKMIERFKRLNYGTLQIDVTIEDPKAYTEPFTVRVLQQLLPDGELFESVCEDRDAGHYLGDAEIAADNPEQE